MSSSAFKTYAIWMQRHHAAMRGAWTKTSDTCKARTNKEAQGRVRKMFQHAGFTYMSLVAVPEGIDPNTLPGLNQP